MKRLIEQKDSISFLVIIMLCEVQLEALEAVKDTALYRHDLKAKAKLFTTELEKVVANDLVKIWGVDDQAMYSLMKQQHTLIKRLATSRPEVWSILNELLDIYEADKDAFLSRNEIVVTDS